MATFKLTLDTDNAAFEENPLEMVRILRDLAMDIEEGKTFEKHKNIYDANGNVVGTCVWK